jgi:hypothetical protein
MCKVPNRFRIKRKTLVGHAYYQHGAPRGSNPGALINGLLREGHGPLKDDGPWPVKQNICKYRH